MPDDQPKPAVTVEIEEVGLRLQNGQEVWPPAKYLGYSIDTNEDRQNFIKGIRASATQMGLNEEWFLGGFTWIVKRTLKIEIVLSQEDHPIEDALNWGEPTNATPGPDQVQQM